MFSQNYECAGQAQNYGYGEQTSETAEMIANIVFSGNEPAPWIQVGNAMPKKFERDIEWLAARCHVSQERKAITQRSRMIALEDDQWNQSYSVAKPNVDYAAPAVALN